MIYAIVGIPLVLNVLNQWGEFLLGGIRLAWFYALRLFDLGKALVSRDKRGLAQACQDMQWRFAVDNSQSTDIPIAAATCILLLWICLCAGVFFIWEQDWTYFQAFYFFFISLTTIGLGARRGYPYLFLFPHARSLTVPLPFRFSLFFIASLP
jgi:Ion channel